MAVRLYCWKCDREVPMFSEEEWAQLEPTLSAAVEEVQARRSTAGLSLPEAISQPYGRKALVLHERLTGELATSVEPLWHHRASLYGPPCASCSKPLRTPRAKMCASCGAARA
jgi:hypothetical protein